MGPSPDEIVHLVAKRKGGALCGAIGAVHHMDDQEVFISFLAVSAAYRRQGIGRTLLMHLVHLGWCATRWWLACRQCLSCDVACELLLIISMICHATCQCVWGMILDDSGIGAGLQTRCLF